MKKSIGPGTVIFDPRLGRDIIIRDINNRDRIAICNVSYIHVNNLGEYTTSDWKNEEFTFDEIQLLIRGEDL